MSHSYHDQTILPVAITGAVGLIILLVLVAGTYLHRMTGQPACVSMQVEQGDTDNCRVINDH